MTKTAASPANRRGSWPAFTRYCEFIQCLLQHLCEVIHSEAFAQRARHPDHPRAFTRERLLTLPVLISSLLCRRGLSVPSSLADFFSHLRGPRAADKVPSDRAFAAARSHLHVPALNSLNDELVSRAEAAGVLGRWRGFRLVAADASVFMPAIRRCLRTRGLATRVRHQRMQVIDLAELTRNLATTADSFGRRTVGS